MKRLLLAFALLVFVLSACSSHINYIQNNPDRLSAGMKPRDFVKAWGEPDETLYYYDFLNKYSLLFSGKIDPHTGAVSMKRYGNRADYSHATVVWIYKKQKRILFFEKGYLVYDSPGALPVVWRLVGWEIMFESPEEDCQRKLTYKITYADGSKYNGDILDGRRHGQGTYTWSDGRKYVGAFENNRASGGWLVKAADKKGWIYQDDKGKWINEVNY